MIHTNDHVDAVFYILKITFKCGILWWPSKRIITILSVLIAHRLCSKCILPRVHWRVKSAIEFERWSYPNRSYPYEIKFPIYGLSFLFALLADSAYWINYLYKSARLLGMKCILMCNRRIRCKIQGRYVHPDRCYSGFNKKVDLPINVFLSVHERI